MTVSISAAELLALPEPHPSNWIVEELIRTGRGRPSLLCGFPESGKSTLSNQLAIAVANGTPFLDRDTKQGHVILWKTEELLEDIASDLRRAGLSSNVSIVQPDPELKQKNMERLEAALKEHPNTRLVIIETFQEFFEGVVDITSNDDCKNVLQMFNRELVTPHPDCAFLILHQFNKSNDGADLSIKKVLGGTALAAGTDGKIYLRQVSDRDTRRVIHATVRKGKPIPPTYLKFDASTLTSRLGDTVKDDDEAKKAIDKARKAQELDTKILQMVGATPGLAKWVLVNRIGGKKQNIGKRIDALVEAGCIQTKPGGEKNNALLLYPQANDAEYLAEKVRGGEHANAIVN